MGAGKSPPFVAEARTALLNSLPQPHSARSQRCLASPVGARSIPAAASVHQGVPHALSSEERCECVCRERPVTPGAPTCLPRRGTMASGHAVSCPRGRLRGQQPQRCVVRREESWARGCKPVLFQVTGKHTGSSQTAHRGQAMRTEDA